MNIQTAYNDWAQQYDSNKNRTRDLDAEATFQSLQGYEFSNVIELGCGTGKNTLYLLEKAEKIIALDFSEAMLAKARGKITDSRVVFKQANILEAWDIPDGFADLITVNLVLEHINDLKPVFAQVFNKLKPGGIFFISELHPYKQYLGTKARYPTENGVQELETYVHHLSDYIKAGHKQSLKPELIDEWFDEETEAPKSPRLISFIFRK